MFAYILSATSRFMGVSGYTVTHCSRIVECSWLLIGIVANLARTKRGSTKGVSMIRGCL